MLGWRQAIIWTNAGMLLIGSLGKKFNEILIESYIFSLKKMHLKMSSAKWWQFCVGVNVLPDRHQTICSHSTFSEHWQTQSTEFNHLDYAISNIDGLMQERRNSIANALELRLSCTNPSICIIRLLELSWFINHGLELKQPWAPEYALGNYPVSDGEPTQPIDEQGSPWSYNIIHNIRTLWVLKYSRTTAIFAFHHVQQIPLPNNLGQVK